MKLTDRDLRTMFAKLAYTLSLLLLLSACSTPLKLDSPEALARHYRIYRGDGTPASMAELLQESQAAQVTFLGEQHDDAVAHHLEAFILEQRWQPELALSLEMFESDVQYVLDEYLAGHISEDHFKRSARAWSEYDSDYRPMIEFAKDKHMIVIAANAPRRYVNMITRLGDEALLELEDIAKTFLPPLPYADARVEYAQKFLALMGAGAMSSSSQEETTEQELAGDAQQAAPEHTATESAAPAQHQRPEVTAPEVVASPAAERPDPQKMLRAQSMWDASMAWSISQHLQAHPDSQVIHVNGSFHSAERMGIPDHLLRYREGTSFLVIAMLYSDSFPAFDPEHMQDLGDFVIVTKR